MGAPLLELSSITKSFGAVRALKGASFDLHAGEVHALLGENGAGKSTLIRIITGAHQPDSGTLHIQGESQTRLTPASAHRLAIACIYQQPALFPDLTVAENIGLRLEPIRPLARVNWRKREQVARDLLRRIGAEISPQAEVRSLSMPEQQLVEIACAVGARARIVVMDEPTASLTPAEVDLLSGVVRDLCRGGTGVIYITHRLEEVFALADRVTVLRDGETVGTRRLPDSSLTETELIRMMVGREVAPLPPQEQSKASDVVLSLRNLGCSFSGVHGISLDVRAGEIVGLAGLVGAGRTELARVLFGVTPADSGEVLLHGTPIHIASPQDAIAHGIAYLPEDRRRHGIILELPVAQNITMASHRRLFPNAWIRPAAEQAVASEFIRKLDVRTPGPDAPGAALSGGNQQKVALARWLVTPPRILILDEPTQGVDIGAKSEIHRTIRQLADGGLAVLVLSSDLAEVLSLSDRIGVMRGGSLVALLPGRTDAHDVMAAALGRKGMNS